MRFCFKKKKGGGRERRRKKKKKRRNIHRTDRNEGRKKKIIPHDMPTGQSDGENCSAEVPLSS